MTSPISTAGVIPMQPAQFEITARRDESADTFTVDMMPVNGQRWFDFQPGQFNMLYAFGKGESAISISGDAYHADVLIHTIRRVGTVTAALQALQLGHRIGVRGPFGSLWPMAQAKGKDLLFVAGGIGLAPLRPAIYQALNHRQDYGRIVLLLGTRTAADILYKEELLTWQARSDFDVDITVDQANPVWRGNVGVVTTRIGKAGLAANKTLAMICGPEIMMRYTTLELNKLGVHDDAIYVTLERNMKCAIGFCGHCQFGPEFVCKDGPVFRFDRIKPWFGHREI